MSNNVTPDILLIPDDFTEDGNLKITMQVMPWHDDGLGCIDLDNWPEEIFELAKNIIISVDDEVDVLPTINAVDFVSRSELTDFFSSYSPNTKSIISEAANSLWHKIFQETGPGFKILREALNKKSNSALLEFNSQPFSQIEPPAVFATCTGDLAFIFRSLFESKDAISLQKHTGIADISRIENLKSVFQRFDLAVAELVPANRIPSNERLARIQDDAEAIRNIWHEDNTKSIHSHEFVALNRALQTFNKLLSTPDIPDTLPEIPKKYPVNATEEEIIKIDYDFEIEKAKNMLGAIITVPTFAHYCGLAIQITLPIQSLGNRERGVLRARFKDLAEDEQKSCWTAFEFKAKEYFIVAEKRENGTEQSCKHGLMKLKDSRYYVDSIDLVNSLDRVRYKLEALTNSEGANDSIPSFDKLRRGIALFDLLADTKVEQEYNLQLAIENLRPDKANIKYLNDLEVGLRPDVAFAQANKTDIPSQERWRPLTARYVRCSHDLIDKEFYNQPSIKRILHHDHGFTIVPTRIESEGDRGLHIKEQELFVWAGESLGLPNDNNAANLIGVDIKFEPWGEPNEHLVPLRENRGYMYGCRVVFPNGVSRTFSEAKKLYSENAELVIGKRCTLSDVGQVPYPYLPDTIPAPIVALLQDDDLVKVDDISSRLGETIENLILRDKGSLKSEVVTRIILPPRISFDKAEVEGQLDCNEEKIPMGAFRNKLKIGFFGPGGSLPEARYAKAVGGGRLWYLNEAKNIWVNVRDATDTRDPINIKEKSWSSRGTVVIFDHKVESEVGRYFPSKYGRTLQAELSLKNVSALNGIDNDRKICDFWDFGDSPFDAKPIVVEVNRAQKSFIEVDERFIKGNKFKCLKINVGPGESCNLALSANSEKIAAHNAVLSIVHAVQKPKQDPVVGTHTFNAVSVTVRNDQDTIAGTLRSWEEIAEDYSKQYQSTYYWPSIEGGSITFFVGEVEVDRKTTGQLRCIAKWNEHGSNLYTRKLDGDWVKRDQWKNEQLFSCDVELCGRVGCKNENIFDFLHDAEGKLRSLSYTFSDGRARKLEVSIQGISRFKRYFTENEDDCSTFSTVELWTECTFRPPPPKIERAIPHFTWETKKTFKNIKSDWARRSSSIRVYLDEGWFASGEGEQLGIILLPDLNNPPPETVARYITQTAADPARPGAKERSWLTPKHFPHLKAEYNVLLYLNDQSFLNPVSTSSENDSTFSVTILSLDVKVESKTNALYCDIDIASEQDEAYTPFIQFGFARFQPHAVSHLRLSTPIQYQMQMLPSREIEVRKIGNVPDIRTFLMKGPGYTPVGFPQGSHAETKSTVDLHVLTLSSDGRNWNAQSIIPGLLPELSETGFQFLWKQEISIKKLKKEASFIGLLVEEFEHLAADSTVEFDQAGAAAFNQIEKRRLVFSYFLRIYR